MRVPVFMMLWASSAAAADGTDTSDFAIFLASIIVAVLFVSRKRRRPYHHLRRSELLRELPRPRIE